MSDLIQLEKCRSCSPHVSYALPTGSIANIIVGVPPAELKYKAISHVWGNPAEVKMTCNHCGAASRVHLKSPAYFCQLMALAGADSYVWLDSISINQDDAQDVATQIAVMGDIYSKAECVSVLLPAGDQKAYDALARILENANRLVDERWKLNYSAVIPGHLPLWVLPVVLPYPPPSPTSALSQKTFSQSPQRWCCHLITQLPRPNPLLLLPSLPVL